MKIDKSTLKDIIMEEIASLDLDEVKLAPAMFDALKKMGKLPKGARIDFSKATSKRGAASKPKQIAKGAKESNPVATKFDVMKKLDKKVGNMATKIIVGALEKDPKVMTTLSMVLKEEVEIKLMEDDFDDLNPGYDAAVGSIMAAFAMNKDLPVDEIAKIAVKNLMRSFNITLKDEEKEEMSPEEYERLKMPGLDERRG